MSRPLGNAGRLLLNKATSWLATSMMVAFREHANPGPNWTGCSPPAGWAKWTWCWLVI